MTFEEQDESTGESRPIADDGPFTLEVDGEIFTVTVRPRGAGRVRLRLEIGAERGVRIFQFSACFLLQCSRPSEQPIQRNSARNHRGTPRVDPRSPQPDQPRDRIYRRLIVGTTCNVAVMNTDPPTPSRETYNNNLLSAHENGWSEVDPRSLANCATYSMTSLPHSPSRVRRHQGG